MVPPNVAALLEMAELRAERSLKAPCADRLRMLHRAEDFYDRARSLAHRIGRYDPGAARQIVARSNQTVDLLDRASRAAHRCLSEGPDGLHGRRRRRGRR